MDREIRAVFIGAAVSMVLSTIALRNHPTDCYVKMRTGNITQVVLGHTYEGEQVGVKDED